VRHSATVPRILFVNPNFEDMLSDGLFHGLRTLLGDDVLEFPKAEPMYSTHPAERRSRLYGRGFTLYGMLEDIPLDRNRCLDRAREGEFDLVVFSDIWRTFGPYTEWIPQLGRQRVAVIDGSDRVEPYPYAGVWWRRRLWWLLPRAHNRTEFFKREITPLTYWFRSYLLLPGSVGRRLGLLRRMRPIAFSIPEEKIVAELPPKEKLLGAHVVDEEVARKVGARSSYVFEAEEDYYADLRASRFGVTTRRAGWDCLRHYELAASGCVPCFRDLDRKPASCAPHGLNDSNCITYRGADELMATLDAIGDEEYERLQHGALAWARANTTRERALAFLGALDLAPGEPAPRERVAASPPPVAH
jgi:hypothetical protein